MSQQSNQPVPTPNGSGIIFLSASRAAATYTSEEFDNFNARGVRIFVSATIAGGATLDTKVQVYDAAAATWRDLTGAAITQITATGAAFFTIYPGLLATATGAGVTTVALPLGLRWRIVATLGTATSTFGISADYLF